MAKRLKTVSAPSHHEICPHHDKDNPELRRCNAPTQAGQRCSRKSRITPIGDYLPVCTTHRDYRIRGGKCQAIAQCGEKCERRILWNPPEFQ